MSLRRGCNDRTLKMNHMSLRITLQLQRSIQPPHREKGPERLLGEMQSPMHGRAGQTQRNYDLEVDDYPEEAPSLTRFSVL